MDIKNVDVALNKEVVQDKLDAAMNFILKHRTSMRKGCMWTLESRCMLVAREVGTRMRSTTPHDLHEALPLVLPVIEKACTMWPTTEDFAELQKWASEVGPGCAIATCTTLTSGIWIETSKCHLPGARVVMVIGWCCSFIHSSV